MSGAAGPEPPAARPAAAPRPSRGRSRTVPRRSPTGAGPDDKPGRRVDRRELRREAAGRDLRLDGQLLRPRRRDAALPAGRPEAGRRDRRPAPERRRTACLPTSGACVMTTVEEPRDGAPRPIGDQHGIVHDLDGRSALGRRHRVGRLGAVARLDRPAASAPASMPMRVRPTRMPTRRRCASGSSRSSAHSSPSRPSGPSSSRATRLRSPMREAPASVPWPTRRHAAGDSSGHRCRRRLVTMACSFPSLRSARQSALTFCSCHATPMMPRRSTTASSTRRVSLPLHPSLGRLVVARALRTGEARALESRGLEATRAGQPSNVKSLTEMVHRLRVSSLWYGIFGLQLQAAGVRTRDPNLR